MKRLAKTIFSVLRVAVGIGMLAYLGLSGAINWKALLGLAAAWRISVLALAVSLAAAVVTAWRLCVLFRPLGLQLSLAASLRLTLIGTFFNSCLPGATGGDVVRIYYATAGNRGRRTEVITVLLLDRGIGMLALVLWPLLAAPFFRGLVASSSILRGLLWGAAGAALAMVLGLAAGLSRVIRQSRMLLWAFRTLPLGGYIKKVFDTVHQYRRHAWALVNATLISLMAHTLTIGTVLLIGWAIHPSWFAWRAALVIPLGFLANTLPVTPGGLGVGEAALNQLFTIAGLDGGAEMLLGWRLLTLLLGLSGLAFYLQGRQRFVHDTAPLGQVDEALSSP